MSEAKSPSPGNSFGFQRGKLPSIRSGFGAAGYTLLTTVVVVALVCSASPALARSGNQGAAVRILEDNPSRIVIRYKFGDFRRQSVRIDGESFTDIYLEGESNKKDKGAPALPDVSRSVIIPDDARMRVRVIDSSYYEIENIDIVPSKGYISRKINPADVPYTFGKAYDTDAFYPGPLAALRRPYIMRDHRGIVVTANPFQYNPVRHVLRIYTDMTIEVASVGRGRMNVLHRRPRKLSRAFNQLYSSHFINYDSARRYTPLDEEGEMLIIVHDAWNSNVQPLKTHKESRGIPTTIVDVGSIGNNASSIKSYIQSVYDSNDLAFVLLVGDAAEVATPLVMTYYGNGAADPNYSLVAGADNYPDLIVGRFSAQSAAQVDTQVERTIEYETLPAIGQSWFWKGVGIASDDVGSPDDGQLDWEHIRKIRDVLLNYGYTEVNELYEGSQSPPGNDDPGNPVPQDVTDCLNDGRGIINYCGHGSPTSWGTTSFSTTNVDALTNDNMLPFIISVACNNGEFNNYSTCFAEAWMRATNGTEPTGAIAIYASSVSQFWAPPMEAQDEFNWLYTDANTPPSYFSFGAHCYAGSCSMMDEYTASQTQANSGIDMFNTWHVFGDPSLSIAGEIEPTPPVAFDGSVSTGINTPVEIELQATDEGQPDPPGVLTYIITLLPSDGSLADPCAGAITSVPYSLASYGNKVVYTPDTDYTGSDEFNFKANDNDGGSDPNGGDSNIATVTITVQAQPIVIYEADFESGLAGWDVNNNFGDACGLWHLTGVCQSAGGSHTTPNSLYYGQDSTCNYDAGLSEGIVTSPVISLASVTPPINLSLKYFLTTEVYSGYDIATLEVSENGGAFTVAASNQDATLSDPSGGWLSKTIDLSAMAGSDIQVRARFRTVDGSLNTYDGFYVDDVNVLAIPGEPCCMPPPEPNTPNPPNDVDNVPVGTVLTWNGGARAPALVGAGPTRRVPADILATIVDDEPDPLPRYPTPQEQQLLEQRRLLREQAPLTRDERFGAPWGPVWTPGEYEQADGVLVRWGSFNALLTEFIVGVSDSDNASTAYVIVTDANQQISCEATLGGAGADMNNVEFITYITDSVWIRDYGPRYFYEGARRTIMDHKYNRPRPLDDAFPAWLGGYWSETVYQLDNLNLEHGGGNFHCVSDGNAFMSTLILDENPSYSEGDIEQIYRDYHNVELTIYDSLPSDVDYTGHIDMWLLPLSDTDILVGQFAPGIPGYTETEAAVTDLEGRGYTVWRTPSRNDGVGGAGGIHYTYTNAAIVNNKVFVPQYGDGNDLIALNVFEQAMPDHEIIGVDCNSIIGLGGAIHCIMKHVYLTSPPVTWDVYLGESPQTLVCSDLSSPMCDPGMLRYCTTYHWQVVAKNYCSETVGPIWTFTTGFASMPDLELFASHWLDTGCIGIEWCFGCDFDKSHDVDFYDFADLALCWRGCP